MAGMGVLPALVGIRKKPRLSRMDALVHQLVGRGYSNLGRIGGFLFIAPALLSA